MTEIKLLIFSDSHGDVGTMLDVVEQERPDEIFHLGDHWRDAEKLSFACPEIPTIMVPGNCDSCFGKNDKLFLERQGLKILLAHGHQWRVKSGSALALKTAREAGADILLYGHTHKAACWREDDLWVMNPGTVGGRWAPATYGVIEIEDAAAVLRLLPVE